MAHLTTYSCRNCGGVLIKDQMQEVLECPFCGNAYDLVRMHSDEYLSRAQVNMQQMEFHAAKEKYETVLSKDPQNFDALQGLVLCSGKVQSEKELRTPGKMKDRAFDEMMAAADDAKKRAAPEHAEYFSVLHQLTELAKNHQLTDKRIDSLSEASSEKFHRFALQDVVRTAYYTLICTLIGVTIRVWTQVPEDAKLMLTIVLIPSSFVRRHANFIMMTGPITTQWS